MADTALFNDARSSSYYFFLCFYFSLTTSWKENTRLLLDTTMSIQVLPHNWTHRTKYTIQKITYIIWEQLQSNKHLKNINYFLGLYKDISRHIRSYLVYIRRWEFICFIFFHSTSYSWIHAYILSHSSTLHSVFFIHFIFVFHFSSIISEYHV